jgi:uncharacterized membrane protein HdeD (DUF308 family)
VGIDLGTTNSVIATVEGSQPVVIPNAVAARRLENNPPRRIHMLLTIVGNWKSLAIRGAAALLFGLLTLVWPGPTLWALVLLWGAYVLVDGISILAAVFTHAPGTADRRGWLIVEGVAGIAAGLVTFVWPDITALALLFVIAAWALVTGVMEIVAAVRLREVLDREWLLGLLGVLSILFAIGLVITPGAGALVITWFIGWYAAFSGILLLALAWRVRKLETALEGAPARGQFGRRPATA